MGFPEEVTLGLRTWRRGGAESCSAGEGDSAPAIYCYTTIITLGGLKQLFYFDHHFVGQGLGKGSAGPPGVG